MGIKKVLEDKLPANELEKVHRAFDMVGDIAVISVPEELEHREEMIGEAVMELNNHIKTVVKRASKTKGVHRVREVEHVVGEEKTETVHVENGCKYALDLNEVYFNPRLGSERLRVIDQVKKGDVVIDLFAGVGPFTIPAAKKCKKVYAVDINPKAVKYLKKNLELNKVSNVEVIHGGAREVLEDLPRADKVIMNLPKTSVEFLDDVKSSCKWLGKIYLYTDQEKVRSPFGFVNVFTRKVLMIGPRVWHYVHELFKWWLS